MLQAAAGSQAEPGMPQLHDQAAQHSAGHLAQETSSSAHQQPTQAAAAEQASTSSRTFPPNLPSLLTTLSRGQSDELAGDDASSSRASSQIPAHSALSRMLQDSSTHEHSQPDDGGGGWTLPAAGGHQQAAPGSSPDSAALQQLLHVVEGLEEELFSSEARRNDAEVRRLSAS